MQHPNGPGGIRTLDLISAIDARSQLRYRPFFQGSTILPRRCLSVKQGDKKVYHMVKIVITIILEKLFRNVRFLQSLL